MLETATQQLEVSVPSCLPAILGCSLVLVRLAVSQSFATQSQSLQPPTQSQSLQPPTHSQSDNVHVEGETEGTDGGVTDGGVTDGGVTDGGVTDGGRMGFRPTVAACRQQVRRLLAAGWEAVLGQTYPDLRSFASLVRLIFDSSVLRLYVSSSSVEKRNNFETESFERVPLEKEACDDDVNDDDDDDEEDEEFGSNSKSPPPVLYFCRIIKLARDGRPHLLQCAMYHLGAIWVASPELALAFERFFQVLLFYRYY